MSRILSAIALVLLIGVGITFTVLNPQQVTLNYLLGSLQLPLAVLVVLVLAVGAVLGLLVAGFMILRLKRENRKLRRGTRLAILEVHLCRPLPGHEMAKSSPTTTRGNLILSCPDLTRASPRMIQNVRS